MRYAIWSVGVNIAFNLALIPTIGVLGPALATAISSTVNLVLLYRTLVKRGHFIADAQLKRRIPRLALAAVLMAAAIWGLDVLLEPWLTGYFVQRYLALAGDAEMPPRDVGALSRPLFFGWRRRREDPSFEAATRLELDRVARHLPRFLGRSGHDGGEQQCQEQGGHHISPDVLTRRGGRVFPDHTVRGCPDSSTR